VLLSYVQVRKGLTLFLMIVQRYIGYQWTLYSDHIGPLPPRDELEGFPMVAARGHPPDPYIPEGA
jgi:hypothetical protein